MLLLINICEGILYIILLFCCCWQLLYAGEGEARKPEDGGGMELSRVVDDKPGTITLKGHEFVQISYHMPTNCEVCPKPLWHMFRPPPALECRSKCSRCYGKENFVMITYNIIMLFILLNSYSKYRIFACIMRHHV